MMVKMCQRPKVIALPTMAKFVGNIYKAVVSYGSTYPKTILEAG